MTDPHASSSVPARPGVPLPIRVLILEDQADDAELILHELRRSGFEPSGQRLETEAEFLRLLQWPPDIILADYQMAELDAPRALELLQALHLDIPLIVVSGAIGEDLAVAIMRQGATDYILKEQFMRLGPAVRRAFEEKQLRNDKRKTEQDLRASETRFYSFMNNNPALAFIKDLDGRILYINNTCEQAWNTTLVECQGKLDHELWPAAQAAGIRALDLSVLDRGESSHVVEELPSLQEPVRHLLTFRFPFADATGCRLIGGVSVDITERMQTERDLAAAVAEKEVLLKEVHHRVKNNLQIISSLLNMQAELLSEPALKEVLQESRRRVESMAMIHERLYSDQDIDHLDFRQYVDALARELYNIYFVDSDLVSLRLELEPVSLELNQAIPCGLILNELLANCLKYAFPDGRRGEILVALCRENERITLRVADNGVGLPRGLDWHNTKSLGLRIVNILARQLKGTVHHDTGAGADFSLIFEKAASRSPIRPHARAASRNGGK
jgi:two-component sensor histidine kinase/AmiR/NasT family two-component response regulator